MAADDHARPKGSVEVAPTEVAARAHEARPNKIVVCGQGYVGLPLAVRAASSGYDVVGFDIDADRVKLLREGESYVEDITAEMLDAVLSSGRYVPTNDPRHCAGFDVAVITVPTPLTDGMPDLSYIEQATRTLARYLRPGATVVLESTTYPGTTDELMVPILEEGSGLLAGIDFSAGYSPERIDPGNRTWNIVNTPKVVSGIDDRSLEIIQVFYGSMIDRVVPVKGTREAELTKLLENTFRHVNIALVNELAMFAADLEIDIWAALEAAATKPFGFMSFVPGPGVGGHCLPIDPSYLSWRVKHSLGHSFRFVELANDINDHMPDYVVRRLMLALNVKQRALNGSRILVLGLTYKPNTGDARESPALAVVQKLLGAGAVVRAVDPYLREPVDARVPLVDLSVEELDAADAVVLLTDHCDFDLALVQSAARYVLDTRGRLDHPSVERL